MFVHSNMKGTDATLQRAEICLAKVRVVFLSPSTAPFDGLFGTVWGIYHALVGIAAAGAITIE